jgi:hypothetical protein
VKRIAVILLVDLQRRGVEDAAGRLVEAFEQLEVLLEPDHGQDGVESVQLGDLRLLAVLVGLGVLRRQPRGRNRLILNVSA